MPPTRRRFLGTLGSLAALGGTTTTACGPHATKTATPPLPSDWASIRALFDLSPDWIHLSALILASHPKPVRDAIELHRRALDANPIEHFHANEGTWRMHEAAAAYMGCAREEIALTDSTTMGLGVTIGGLAFRPGDDLIASTHDHFSLHEALRLAATRTGASFRRLSMYATPEKATAAGMIDAVAKAILPATRLVCMTWVHSSSGVKIPMRAIADVVAGANAKRSPEERILLLVDGVHGFGVEPDDVPALGADVFVSGTHKWIFGPRGTGVVWATREAYARMNATLPSFGDDAFHAWKQGTPPPPSNAFMMTPGGYHSFEHRWSLPEAFDFHRVLGKKRVADRTHALNRRLKEGLAKLANVTLRTPMDDALSAGIVCFDVTGLSPEQVVDRLRRAKIVATHTVNSPPYARLSAAVFNTEDEIDRVVQAVAALS